MTDISPPTSAPHWDELDRNAQELIPALAKQQLMLATAESCTGGLICGLLTGIPGSSDVIDRGFVTYSNEAKQDLVNVTAASLENYGAVSPQVAAEMAAGALANSRADIAISVTGIAGPGGGTPQKPVGTVHFGLAIKGQDVRTFSALFEAMDRTDVRLASVAYCLKLISNFLCMPKGR
ncbi:CinA family protein [Roseibium sp. CAU 1637]|uniref:CinA family protein n=1 Tax=Roseibium limicola TaxID=2816037 RepID=A0A939EKS3_9HYPH|nr:CinA family protein [Roseibium limicola]MBO0344485.1 CinA family protein [Roseibium limicola]